MFSSRRQSAIPGFRLQNYGFKKSFHDIHGENKSCACRRDIEGNCIYCPDGRLNTAGIAGIIPIRGRSPENDDIQLFRGNSRCRKRPLSCLRRQMARSLSGGDPAFPDSGPCPDPLVIRVHDLRQIVVRNQIFRHIRADSSNSGCHHLLNPAISLMRRNSFPRSSF